MIHILHPLRKDGTATIVAVKTLSPNVNVRAAIRSACIEYSCIDGNVALVGTELYDVDWDGFTALVPNEICIKHNIEKIPIDEDFPT